MLGWVEATRLRGGAVGGTQVSSAENQAELCVAVDQPQ